MVSGDVGVQIFPRSLDPIVIETVEGRNGSRLRLPYSVSKLTLLCLV